MFLIDQIYRHRFAHYLTCLCCAFALLAPNAFCEPAADASRNISRGSLRGILLPAHDLQLSSRAAGVIEQFGAAEGQQVTAGDLLVQLNADIERADVANAEAVLEGANAEWERTKRELERATALSRDSIGSKRDLEDAQHAHLLASSRQKQAKANLATAHARLAERAILAPISGLLFKRSREVGEAVERLEPVVRLVDASKLEFVVYAGAELLGKFAKGQITHILIDSGPARGAQPVALVTYIDPIIDPESGTFRIKLQVKPSETIQPGLSATLQIPSEVN